MVLAASIDAGVRMRVPILRTSPAQEQGFETKYRSYEDRPDHHDGGVGIELHPRKGDKLSLIHI